MRVFLQRLVLHDGRQLIVIANQNHALQTRLGLCAVGGVSNRNLCVNSLLNTRIFKVVFCVLKNGCYFCANQIKTCSHTHTHTHASQLIASLGRACLHALLYENAHFFLCVNKYFKRIHSHTRIPFSSGFCSSMGMNVSISSTCAASSISSVS